MKVTKSEGQRVLASEGVVGASIAHIVDMGSHDTQFGVKRQLQIAFILDETHVFDQEIGEEPFMLTTPVNMVMNERSTLYKIVEAALNRKLTDKDFAGGGFDMKQLLGKGLLVTVTHKESGGNTYANITAYTGLPKGMKAPAIPEKVPQAVFSLDEFDQDVFDGLYDWQKDKIKQSTEYQQLEQGKTESPFAE